MDGEFWFYSPKYILKSWKVDICVTPLVNKQIAFWGIKAYFRTRWIGLNCIEILGGISGLPLSWVFLDRLYLRINKTFIWNSEFSFDKLVDCLVLAVSFLDMNKKKLHPLLSSRNQHKWLNYWPLTF